MIRYIIFDTETTGLDPLSGDRVIEIGCVEILDREITNREYQQYINPECEISQETIDITHITNDIVKDKPIFRDIAQNFLDFINDNKTSNAEKNVLVAHNASFDIKFLNHELKLAGFEGLNNFELIDTLDIARAKFPGQKATLDMLCDRFGISLEERRKSGHGALLDAKILAEVFIKLTDNKALNISNIIDDNRIDFVGIKKRENTLEPRDIYILTEIDEEKHKQFLIENNITLE